MASQDEALGEIRRALRGVTFPAGKADLAEFAHGSFPNDESARLLAQLPDREYATMAEMEAALAEAMRTPPSRGMAERSTPRDPSSEQLEAIQPLPADQLGAAQKNQRSVESALDPNGLPQSEHYGKRSGARPTDQR